MLSRQNPTLTQSWSKLKTWSMKPEALDMQSFFLEDKERFASFSREDSGILLDFSKNRINQEILNLLLDLASECHLEEGIRAMFAGEKINETENRAVLHIALRKPSGASFLLDGKDIMPDVVNVREKMREFSHKVRSGSWRGYTGKSIRHVVNLGIGGSDLGPLMVCEALKGYSDHRITSHFVSNVDASHLAETLRGLNPDETLFLIASKTFTTQETMTNAFSARAWFLEAAVEESHIAQHFVAISTNTNAVVDFGIDFNNMFIFWDWVGGRYSLTSAIGLSICLNLGYDIFERLLAGFHHMDEHFRTTPLMDNMPVLLALVGIWNVNFLGATNEAVLPYNQYLHRFPAYLQQTNMESNGKCIDRKGDPVSYATGPVIWGEPGTNGQHAFYQLIHQGTTLVPCDFIVAAKPQHPIADHHEKLIANFLAQAEALMLGKSPDEVLQELSEQGLNPSDSSRLMPFKVFSGNKPSNAILLDILDPFNLGRLIALYEHKIFTQGVIWNIFSFDQWGVELGKHLANVLLPKLVGVKDISGHDGSTQGLMATYKKFKTR